MVGVERENFEHLESVHRRKSFLTQVFEQPAPGGK